MIKLICDRCKRETTENEFNTGLVVVDSKWDLCNNCKEALENFMLNEVAYIKAPVVPVITNTQQKSDKVLRKHVEWKAKPINDAETVEKILELKKKGLSRREISRRLAIGRGVVGATVTDLEAKGLLEKDIYSGKVRGGLNHATLPDSEKVATKKKQKPHISKNAELTDIDRTIIKMRQNGKTFKEISEVVGINVSSVYKRLVKTGYKDTVAPREVLYPSVQQDYYKDTPKMIQRTVTDSNGCVLEVDFIENH